MTSLALSYIPIIESMHVYLNGLEARYLTDWTYDSVTNSVIAEAPLDVRSSDKLECLYAHHGAVLPPVIYTAPTVVGTPWGYLVGGSGLRRVFFRLEGLDLTPPTYDHNIIVGMEQRYDGPGSYDIAPGSYAFNPSGYASNIYQMDILRPYTEPGEAPFTKIHVFVGEWYSSHYVSCINSPAPIYYAGDAGSPPPTSYQG